jgi:hypothetical protein
MKVGPFVISARDIAPIREHRASSSLEDAGAKRSRRNSSGNPFSPFAIRATPLGVGLRILVTHIVTQQKPRISSLLVADHEDSAEIMSRLPPEKGYSVQTVGAVGEALKIFWSTRVHLLISECDLERYRESGFDAELQIGEFYETGNDYHQFFGARDGLFIPTSDVYLGDLAVSRDAMGLV